jgi:hypothetical protein
VPTPEISFLVRGADGRCVTVLARTERGALRRFMTTSAGVRTPSGSTVSVKPRGEGEWIDFRITR